MKKESYPQFSLVGLGYCPNCQQQLNQQELVDYKTYQNSRSNTYVHIEMVCFTCNIAYDCDWTLDVKEQKHIPTVVQRFARIR